MLYSTLMPLNLLKCNQISKIMAPYGLNWQAQRRIIFSILK